MRIPGRPKRKRLSPPELDLLTVRQLRGRGADLTRPRHILHFLSFADEGSARRAAAELESAAYGTSLEPGEQAADWVLRAETTRVVDETTVRAFRPWFERVASDHGGRYDGWEAATEP